MHGVGTDEDRKAFAIQNLKLRVLDGKYLVVFEGLQSTLGAVISG